MVTVLVLLFMAVVLGWPVTPDTVETTKQLGDGE